jgi:hypothetical protein
VRGYEVFVRVYAAAAVAQKFAMKFVRANSSVLVVLIAAPVCAAPDTHGVKVHRLSDIQIAAIADAQAQRSDVAPMGVAEEPLAIDDDGAQPKRKIHGEIGFGIGSGGYSEVFGTVVTPLGDNGVFAFTFAQQNGAQYNRYRRH